MVFMDHQSCIQTFVVRLAFSHWSQHWACTQKPQRLLDLNRYWLEGCCNLEDDCELCLHQSTHPLLTLLRHHRTWRVNCSSWNRQCAIMKSMVHNVLKCNSCWLSFIPPFSPVYGLMHTEFNSRDSNILSLAILLVFQRLNEFAYALGKHVVNSFESKVKFKCVFIGTKQVWWLVLNVSMGGKSHILLCIRQWRKKEVMSG